MSEQISETKKPTPHDSKGFQFGVRQLLMYVVFVAVSFGLLKSPYVILSIIAKTFVIGALITAILLAIYRAGRLRAFWIGFAIVGSIYFYLTAISDRFRTQPNMPVAYTSYVTPYGIQSFNEESSHILTNWILLKVFPYMTAPSRSTTTPPGYPTLAPPPYIGPATTMYAPQEDNTDSDTSTGSAVVPPVNTTLAYQLAQPYVPQTFAPMPITSPTIPWDVFYSNGQCIFTILFAYVGGMFAQWLYVKRENGR